MVFVPPKDRVLEHSTSNSQTVFAVTGAIDTSFNAFNASMSVGDTTIGGVVEGGVAFVSGILTYSATNQITVTTVKESKGTFSSGGVKEVFMGQPAASQLIIDGAQTFTATQQLQARSNIGISVEIGNIEWWPISDVPTSRLKANGGSYLRATYPDLSAFLIKTGAATFTNGSSSVGMTAHGRSVGDPIKLFTNNTLPTNFTAGTHGLATVGTNYYIKTVVDANTVILALTTGGTAITAGSTGFGIHTWVNAPYGDGDGSTTFTVPDYRGSFLRAWDNGASIDANRAIGDVQLDAFQGHRHAVSWTSGSLVFAGSGANGASGGGTGVPSLSISIGDPTADGSTITPRTALETRPRNVSANVTIRYAA